MILNRKQIIENINNGDIVVNPLDEKYIGVNSIDLRLSPKMKIYTNSVLDAHSKNPLKPIEIPEEGLILDPNELYIATTIEHTETKNLVPMLVGRSSIGRLGIFIHITAGFGDIGFRGQWTLEITCVKPVKIYPNMKIGQIYYHTTGENPENYQGRYQDQVGAQGSGYHKGLHHGVNV